jgi:DNA polymerase-3 subunit epsilon
MRMAARRQTPVRTGLSLRACAAAHGVPSADPHTALGDARTTAALFGHVMAQTDTVAPGPAPAALEATLSQAAGVRWPEPPRRAGASDALWRQRSNVSAQRNAPNVRHGSA